MRRFSKKLFLLLCSLLATMVITTWGVISIYAATVNESTSHQIVINGQANAVVVVHENANSQTSKAASVLVEYVKKSTGAELAIMTEEQLNNAGPLLSGFVHIYVGESALIQDSTLSAALLGLKDDGFIIRSNSDRIMLIGTNSWGTIFAVNEWLERYIGVRWILPGESGEDVPIHTDVSVPIQEIVKEPAFSDRMISPILPGANIRFPVQVEWAERNNTHYSITFSHALFSYFPTSLYGTSNPEFYPTRNGVPYIPPAGVTTGWQPCFSVKGTVDAAVQGVLNYFAANPTATTASLGVNDGGGYCLADLTNPDKNLSDIYYDWVNQVVVQVLNTYPDKRFGLLAYGPIQTPPSFPLHSSVVPFITKDRMAWSDPQTASDDQDLTLGWGQVATNIGWYDYTYGSSYSLPRVYPHLMAQYYQFAMENKVSSQYTELYPNWGEGPKAWVMAKLLWDPNLDVEALLNEWYVRTAGAQAASELKAYYDHWESFWMGRVQQTQWFQASKDRINLEFANSGYLNIVTEVEIAENRQRLEAALSKAETEQQKARITILLREFEQYEAAALSYPKQDQPPSDSAQAIAALDRISETLDTKLQWAVRRNEILDSFKSDPILMLPFAPPQWSGWNSHDFWNLTDYLKQSEPNDGSVREKVRILEQEAASPNMRHFAGLLQQVSAAPATLVANSSFEEGNGDAPPWLFWTESTGTIKRVEGVARTGNASLQINNLHRGGPAQIIPVRPGLIASNVYYYTPPGTMGSGSVQWAINMMDAEKRTLYSLRSDQKTIVNTVGQWASINYLEEVPPSFQGKEIKFVQFVVIVDNIPSDTSLYLDDIGVYQSELQGDGDLSLLSVSGTIQPLFNPAVTEYSVEVSNETARIEITARSADEGALMMVYGNPLIGKIPRTFNLKVGENVIPIVVVAPNGAIKTYTVRIIRE